ncbi:hypothetical protein [Psychromicrobium lacuslunae]|uniref:hypothetical protein n=1 Tax=Psychromicrobium lacuslunae TaxID=1618207 RepID=UPI000A9DD0F5|nr:hypothetical protein [Psychromicrobium lacuslunae]
MTTPFIAKQLAASHAVETSRRLAARPQWPWLSPPVRKAAAAQEEAAMAARGNESS